MFTFLAGLYARAHDVGDGGLGARRMDVRLVGLFEVQTLRGASSEPLLLLQGGRKKWAEKKHKGEKNNVRDPVKECESGLAPLTYPTNL